MKKSSSSNKKRPNVAIPTQQDYEQDRFYYNNDEDTREVLQDFGYNTQEVEEQRVSRYW